MEEEHNMKLEHWSIEIILFTPNLLGVSSWCNG